MLVSWNVISGMKSLPELINQVTNSVAESLGSSWAVSISTYADGLFPLSVYGNHPCIESCVRHIGNVVWRERQISGLASMGVVAFSGTNRPDAAPRMICPLTVGSTTCLLVFGPKLDGREYSAADRTLVSGLTTRLPAVEECLPPQPAPEGIDYFGACGRREETDGEFCDFISCEPSSLLVTLGEVAAADTASTIIMAGLLASLRALAQENSGKLSKLVDQLNRIVRGLAPSNFLAAMFLGYFNSERQYLRYVNAGHEPPLLIRANRVHALRLETTTAALGLTDSAKCGHRTIPLQPHDVFVALADNRPVWSERVVLDVVLKNPEAPCGELARLIGERFGDWPAPMPVVVVRATEPPRTLAAAA